MTAPRKQPMVTEVLGSRGGIIISRTVFLKSAFSSPLTTGVLPLFGPADLRPDMMAYAVMMQ